MKCPYCGSDMIDASTGDDARYMHGIKPVSGPRCEFCGLSALVPLYDEDDCADQPTVIGV
jgi:hypothetical protein